MKKCPYCAEDVDEAAIKCKHCHEFLDIPKPPPVPPRRHGSRGTPGQPWYFQPTVVVIALLSVGPLALPMVWWHPRLRWPMKLLISLIVVLLTWGCVWAILALIDFLQAQWALLQTM